MFKPFKMSSLIPYSPTSKESILIKQFFDRTKHENKFQETLKKIKKDFLINEQENCDDEKDYPADCTSANNQN